jgi:DNA-binding MarR family transcriptional regulator
MSQPNQAQLLRENLRILVRKLGILDRGEASCCGLTLSQSYTIVEIGRAGTISVNLLTEILGVDKSTVSKSVDKLVNNGVLIRDTDPEDRRSVILRLTDEGQAVFGEIEKRSTEYFEDVAAAMPGDKREQIVEGLQYLIQALNGPGVVNKLPGVD